MSDNKSGVYVDIKKNGRKNYRASITINNKHISLGSYSTSKKAHDAYVYATKLKDSDTPVTQYPSRCALSYDKFVIICNLRDNNIYIATPIYLERRYFSYYYSPTEVYKFDMDDLFYFSSHKIMKRGNHLFVSDYGSQVSVQERFGIKAFSVPGRDFLFINGDSYDYRRENLEVINRFFGVTKEERKMKVFYKATINIKGKFVIGKYNSEEEAAIAFNKAVDILTSKGIAKKYPQNYLEGISAREYAEIYSSVEISDKILSI